MAESWGVEPDPTISSMALEKYEILTVGLKFAGSDNSSPIMEKEQQ